MLQSARTPLGAPGVFALPEAHSPSLHPQRMDVCAFVGVAPRGPAREPVVNQSWPSGYRMVTDLARPLKRSVPVAVRSFDEYRRVFGGFEGPGLLPHAVASYFEQGGRLAWIVRIVPERTAAFGDGRARGSVAGVFTTELKFLARNEGSWGNQLKASIKLSASSLASKQSEDPMLVEANSPVCPGSTLRLTTRLGKQSLAQVSGLRRVRDNARARERWQVEFESPVPQFEQAELIEARIEISDGQGNQEYFDHLALLPDHPHSLAQVLCERSSLIWPHPDWAANALIPADIQIEDLRGHSQAFSEGKNAWDTLRPSDFFDPHWSSADELPGEGIQALAHHPAITQLVVPDLYHAAQWRIDHTEIDASGGAGAEFSSCVEVLPASRAPNTPPSALTGLFLDPRTNEGLEEITRLQHSLVEFCSSTQSLIALIDVPPGLSQTRIERWRATFDSCWVAAYHPWLVPARRNDDALDRNLARRPLPPSAVAAGIIARREFERGLQYGPANEIARQIIHVAEPQPAGRAEALHPLNINCFVRQPDGIALIAARTLSRERDWRQLSVRRLMLMLRRTLLEQTQWAVFEPNGPALWRDLQHAIESLLRGLQRIGAFAGHSEADSFFVRVLHEESRRARGELLVEIGVAPAEPLEFILVRLRRDGDGTLSLEE